MQSKRRSLLEATTMTVLGMAYAVPLNYYMINEMIWSSKWAQSFWITVVFVAISIVFKYVMRRFFNWLDHKHPTCPVCGGVPDIHCEDRRCPTYY